jgi:L-threonylcarbamoyladenylate synthase
VRLPDHDLMRQVLRKANLPVAAPSANPFGRLSPTTADHVRKQLGERIDGILDGGPCRVGIESTILQIDGGRVTLLRPGGISLEEIESLIGDVHLPQVTDAEKPTAPGMLASHYSPRTPLILVNEIPNSGDWSRTGLLALHEQNIFSSFSAVEVLSPTGDLVVAASRFFQALHRLDSAGLDKIIALRFPDKGLGRALNDRLQRAAHSECMNAMALALAK